jgi:hypothetical protein
MKHPGELKITLCMKILYWSLYKYYGVGAQVRRLVSIVGWCLHNILLSCCSIKEINVSSTLVSPQYISELVLK